MAFLFSGVNVFDTGGDFFIGAGGSVSAFGFRCAQARGPLRMRNWAGRENNVWRALVMMISKNNSPVRYFSDEPSKVRKI